MSKYRLSAVKISGGYTSYIIEKKIMFLWFIPIWLKTDYVGHNPVEMNKLTARLNRGN